MDSVTECLSTASRTKNLRSSRSDGLVVVLETYFYRRRGGEAIAGYEAEACAKAIDGAPGL